MAYNIDLSPNQEFSASTANTPPVTPWQFTPAAPLNINYEIGALYPTDIDIATNIFNYISGQVGSNYVSFKVYSNISVRNSPINPADIVELQGPIADAQPSGYELTLNNLEVTNTLHFTNLFSILPGLYNLFLNFNVVGLDSNDNEYPIDWIRFGFNLNVVSDNVVPVYTTPEVLNFEHIKNEDLPASKEITVTTTGVFQLRIDDRFSISGGNIELLDTEPGVKIYQGSETQTLNLALTTAFNDIPQGLHVGYLNAYNSYIQEAASIDLFVSLYDTDDVTISRESLTFFAIKNILEAEGQIIDVFGPGEITVQTPLWLTSEVQIDQQEKQVIIRPIETANLSVGSYEGVVTITVESYTFEVDIFHEVYHNIKLGLIPNALNFTDDYNTISEFYESQQFRVELHADLLLYNYGQRTFIEKPLDYVLGLFKNAAKFFLGESVRNMMNELDDLNKIGLDNLTNQRVLDSSSFFREYYNPAEVELSILFRNNVDTELNHSSSASNISFIKGRKPIRTFPNTVYLNYYGDTLRVTPNSHAIFNFYKTSAHTLRVYKNDALERSINHAPGRNRVFAYKHKFDAYKAGDVVEIRLYKDITVDANESWFDNTENYLSQKYFVFPEGLQSYHIGWEDEFGCLDLMEFTGEFKFPLEYTNQIVDGYKDFLEIIKKVDSKRSQKLICNTGFILKDNTKRIDALLASKRAWLISAENEPSIKLVPVTKKNSNTDSELDVYQFTIEFEINFNNDFKIY